jgi:hypothetical protein
VQSAGIERLQMGSWKETDKESWNENVSKFVVNVEKCQKISGALDGTWEKGSWFGRSDTNLCGGRWMTGVRKNHESRIDFFSPHK